MARPLRIEFPGAIYHITSRGNGKQTTFHDDADYQKFLQILAKVTHRYHWKCHAYCLTENHYHLLIETPEGNLSAGMRQVNGIYTQYFNRQHEQVGHLFQGRYKSKLVEKQSYLLEVCRYIVLNPVRAHLVPHPKKWLWSSYNATAGSASKPDCLHIQWVLYQFARKQAEAQPRYRTFVLDGINKKERWQTLPNQAFLGSDKFIRAMRAKIDDTDKKAEAPKYQKYAGRPTLGQLIKKAEVKNNKKLRNRLIQEAHIDHGYYLKEIADHLNIHYTTVSKIINR